MSLLQEIKKHGLADCEFNRQLIRNERRVKRLLSINLPIFNDHQEIEGDYDMTITAERAKTSGHFWHWLEIWSDVDRRGELLELLRGIK